MGVLAYWAIRRRAERGAVLPAWSWPPLLLAAFVGSSVAFARWENFPVLRVLFSAALGLAIPLVRDARPSAWTRLAHTVATYSYGIYLIHAPALHAGYTLLGGRSIAAQWLGFLTTLVAGCWVAYHVVEKPGLAFGRRLLGERRAVASTAATAPAP